MRVLLASNMCAYPGNWDKLDALGRHVDLDVITPRRWSTPEELHPVEAVPAHRGGTWRHHRLRTITQGNPFRFIFDPFALAAVIRSVRPDIVHVEQEPESLALLEIAAMKPLFGYRLVFVAWENVNPLRLGWGFRKASFALADGGIFGNQAALARARRLGYGGLGEVLPQYGFAMESTTGAAARTARKARLRVGFAGRLVPEKGIDSLLDAIGDVPELELVVAGDGPLRADLGRTPRVDWRGTLDRGAMAGFWGDIDVLVLPSLTTRKWAEQFGRVLVEAMARGVVVVGSSSGAIPEVIGEAGLVYPEGDAHALAGTLRKLAADRALRTRLRRAGLERAWREYDPDVVAAKTVAFYERVLRG